MTKKLIAAFLLLLASTAHANQWTGPFTITELYISEATNYHVRVFGFPAISACPNGSTWAYMNTGTGASEYYAALMIAYSTGKQVNLYVGPDGNGYCAIIEVTY